MKLYSYIITRDYGFAPNPFYGYCTLATCKPIIRHSANIGDVIVGLGSGAKDSPFKNKVIYSMIVKEKMTYDQYWNDCRFWCKRPYMYGSKKQMYGDNIYHTDEKTHIIFQEDSHHSLENGETNYENYNRDVPGKYVLVSDEYWYWGGNPVELPIDFIEIANVQRNHIIKDNKEFIEKYLEWLRCFSEQGYINKPYKFSKPFQRYDGK